jgi:hypothetical protein
MKVKRIKELPPIKPLGEVKLTSQGFEIVEFKDAYTFDFQQP